MTGRTGGIGAGHTDEQTPPKRRLAIAVHAGGFDRVHYALVLASAASALNRPVTLFFTGRAIQALLPSPRQGIPAWYDLDAADDGTVPADRDARLRGLGVGGFEELLTACVTLGVEVLVCEMALRAMGLPDDQGFRPDVPVTLAGAVTYLGSPHDQLLFV